MRSGMQPLLELLRGKSFDAPVDEAALGALLALAEEEGVLALATAHLRGLRLTLPPAVADSLLRIERDSAIAAFFFSAQLEALLRAFRQRGIEVVPLKGPCLAERLYGSAALRSCRDLDLLVRRADLAQAEALLREIDFLPDEADDYHRQWIRGTLTVELHHDVENPLTFDFHVDQAFQRALPATFQGEPIRQFVPEDELLYLCLHAAHHRYERLSLVLDLERALESFAPPPGGWPLREDAAGLGNLLLLGLAMARRLQPDLSTPVAFSPSKRQTGHVERVADRLWQQLLGQPSQPLDWSSVHAFYVEIETPGRPRLRRRWRHIRVLAGRVIDADYAFAARFGLHRPWQAKLLRPLRLIVKAIGRPRPGTDAG